MTNLPELRIFQTNENACQTTKSLLFKSYHYINEWYKDLPILSDIVAGEQSFQSITKFSLSSLICYTIPIKIFLV